jgi:predicted acylesterase/phospholipase RssA
MIKNLVVGAGGIRGLGALGLLQKLYENNKMVEVENYAGSSVGSIISLLLLVGYYPIDIFKILCDIDFNSLMEDLKFDSFDEPCIGLFSQSKLIYIIKKMISNKNISVNITFQELYNTFNKTLYITGTCVNTIDSVIFSHKTHPEMNVITAIAISTCIPCIFKPIEYNKMMWIDGGCLLSYPIHLFDDDLENTIGIYLNDLYEEIKTFDSIQQYLLNVFKCLLKNSHNIDKKYDKYTYYILTSIKITWNLTCDEKKKYYNFGYDMLLKD